MAKEYKVGERYYLPVTVERIVEGEFGVTLSYTDGDEGDTALIWNAPDLLLTANEIAENIAGRRCAECLIMYDEVKARNAELEALLKEVTATRDEAIRQNDELITKNNELEDANRNLTKACSEWQVAAQAHFKTMEKLREENKKLKQQLAERDELLSDAADRIKTLEEAADRSIFFEKIANQQEVIDALVEKIRRLKGGET